MIAREAPHLRDDPLDLALKLVRRGTRHAWIGAIVVVLGVALTLGFIKLKPRYYLSESVLHYEEGMEWDSQQSPRQVGQRLKDALLARSQVLQIIAEFGLCPRLVSIGQMDEAVDDVRKKATFKINESGTFTVGFAGESPEVARRVTARFAEILVSGTARLRSEQVEDVRGFLDAQRKRTEENLRAKETDLARFLVKHPEFVQDGTTSGAAAREPDERGRGTDEVTVHDYRAELVAAERQARSNIEAARRELADQRRRFTEKHPAVVTAATALKEAEEGHKRAAAALQAAGPAPLAPAPTRAEPHRRRAPAVELETEYARLTRDVAEERDRLQKLESRRFVATMAATSFSSGHGARLTVVDPAYKPTRPTGVRSWLLLLAGTAASTALGLGVTLLFTMLDDRVYDRQDVDKLGLTHVLAEVSLRGSGRDEPTAPAPDRRAGATVDPGRGTVRLLPSPTPEMLEEVEAWLNDEPPRRLLPSKGTPSQGDGPLAESTALAVPTEVTIGMSGGGTSGPGFASPRARCPPPQSTDRADHRLLLIRAPNSKAAASFRVLRYRLAELGAPRTILVTSPGVGEGKTTCAVNLALALSETGNSKVLLLDANFRRPALAELLGVAPPNPTVGPDVDPEQLWGIVEPVTPSLYLASARLHPEPPVLDALSIGLRLEQIGGARYDAIIIDGPPVLGSAEVNAIAESVDGILITMRPRTSRAKRLREAVEQIGSRKVLGVVLLG